jgi:hypothetical protein
MKRLILFTGSSGLDTETDPVRHKYSETEGVRELSIAKNIDFDLTGRPSNRKGRKSTTVSGNCHSLFSHGNISLFVTEDALTLLSPSFSTKALRNVTIGARMSYAPVGNKVYYANGREIGFIRDTVSVSWSRATEVYNVKDSTIVLNGPPTGSLLEYYKGRMLIAQHNVIWESEQYDVNSYNLAKRFVQLEDIVTMVNGVIEGLWVGTRNRIAFLRGNSTSDYKYEIKGLFGVFPGTPVLVDSFLIGDGRIPEIGVLFATKYGPCLGTADGRLVPLTDRKLSVPNAVRGAGAVINNKYVFALED